MPKPEKVAAVEEIKEKLDSSAVAILTESQGLNVAEMGLFSSNAADSTLFIFPEMWSRYCLQPISESNPPKGPNHCCLVCKSV